MDKKEYHIKQVTFSHDELITILSALSKLDPIKASLDVMQDADKSLSYRLTFTHEVKEVGNG